MKQRLDAGAAQPDQPHGSAESPYLTAQEALVYLRLGSLSALYRAINEHGLPTCRLGRHYRFEKRELDAWLRGTSALELRRAQRKAS